MNNQAYLANNTGTYIRKDVFEAKHKATFTIKNLKKQNEIRLGNMWRAKKMKDTIECYQTSSDYPDYIKVPVGIRSFFITQFTNDYHDNQIVEHNQMTRTSYDYQSSAVQDLLTQRVGLLHASTGSGKTQMICDITVRSKRKTLIMVQNLTQMSQMVDDIFAILGVTATQVSGKKISNKAAMNFDDRITICSIDSRDKINTHDYGLILLDECDTYLGSDARREWVGSLSPEFLYGLTGTIKVNHVDDSVFKLYFGKTTELKLLHHTPDYIQVLSSFNFQLDDIKEFYKLKEALYSAESRNKLIVSTVLKNISGRKGLVFCEYVEHAKELQRLLEMEGVKTHLLIGEVPKEERERIRNEVRDYVGDCVIIGSVKIIGRGFDIQELSFAILTTCEKFQSNQDQYVGRIIRQFEGKPHPVFYDITDPMVGILNNQSRQRIKNFKHKFPGAKMSII